MPELKCQRCGKEFKVPKVRLQTAKFCSTECKYRAMERDGRIDAVCETCGKTFKIYPSRLKYGGGRFCSVECVDQGKKSGSSKWWVLDKGRIDLDMPEMVKMYREGYGTTELAKHFGVCRATANKYLKLHGVELRSDKEAQRVRSKLGKSVGPNNARWQGGRKIDYHGYVFVFSPNHLRASKNYVREHILVWEKFHGKPVPDGFDIHHKDEVRTNNDPENLVALSKSDHTKLHVKLRKIKKLQRQIDAILTCNN